MEIEIITRSLKSGGQQKQYITRSLLMYLKMFNSSTRLTQQQWDTEAQQRCV